MRDLRTTLTRSRRSRRATLAVLILTAYPATAEQPHQHQLRMMPPLPLQAISGGPVHSNPFCEPENLAGANAIQLASGDGSIRLKPVHGEIGFQAIQDEAVKISPPAVSLEPIAPPEIQQNPLVKSTHHDNADLVETTVGEPDETPTSIDASILGAPAPTSQDIGPGVKRSSIILIPPVKTCVEPLAPTPLEESVRILAPPATIRQSSLLPDPVIPNSELASPPAAVSITSEPIVFSLSDQPDPSEGSDPPEATDVGASETNADSLEQLSEEFLRLSQADDTEADTIVPLELDLESDTLDPLEPGDGELVEFDPFPEPAEPLMHAQESAEALLPPAEETIDIADVQPIVLDRLDSQPSLVDESPADRPAAVRVQRSQPNLLTVEKPSDPSLHSQRYRPPVAVTPVPITFQRGEERIVLDQMEPDSAIQPVEIMELTASSPKALVASNIKLTPLYMKSAQVRSLTVAGELRDVKIGDQKVCQAVPSGPNQLKLIGTGDGVTQLVVWAQTDDPENPIRMRAFEIHVDRVDPAVEEGGSTAKLLNQSIRNAFPHCNVVLSQEGGELIVSGRCDSDESAEKIIRMIRKTCLVPVQDRLIVH